MSEVRADAEREVGASAPAVFEFLCDYRERRPAILTDNYSDYGVEQGGVGAGTIVAYRFRAGRREREYRLRVEVPEPGRTLLERDEGSSFVTTWTVDPIDEGRSRVALVSTWRGAGGIGGFFERTFAPTGLRRVYDGVLERLAAALPTR